MFASQGGHLDVARELSWAAALVATSVIVRTVLTYCCIILSFVLILLLVGCHLLILIVCSSLYFHGCVLISLWGAFYMLHCMLGVFSAFLHVVLRLSFSSD